MHSSILMMNLPTTLTTDNLRWFIWLIRRKGDVWAQLINAKWPANEITSIQWATRTR